MRRLTVLLVLGVMTAIGGWAAGTSYPASPCTDGVPAETHGSGEINVTNPATGGHVYTQTPDATATRGYVGTHGTTGYVEAYGDAGTRTGAVDAQTADGNTAAASIYAGRNGKIVGICVSALGTTLDLGV